MTDEPRDPRRESGSARSTDGTRAGPVGTVLGATLGPFGWAVGSVVDRDRFAFTFSVGTGATTDRDDGVVVEIDERTPESSSETESTVDVDQGDVDPEDGAAESGADDGSERADE